MPANPPGSRKGPKFLDVKVFIATLALAVTIGLWNLLSMSNLQVSKANPDPLNAPAPQASGQDAQGLGPIPTLVPLVEVDTSGSLAEQPVSGGGSNANQPATALRSVTAPDQTIVQKAKPVFEQPQVVVVSGGSGGGSGGAATVTTRSSK